MSDSQVEDRPASKSIRPLLMLVPFIKPYWGTLVLALIALLSASAAVLVMPLAIRDVIDQGFSADNAAQIDQYFYVLLIIAILIGVLGAARAYFVNWLGERVVADLREQVFGQVLAMDMKFFETTKVGEILSRLTTDTTLIQSISGVGLSIVLRSSIQFIGALILLAFTNFSLTAVLVVLLFVVIAPIMVMWFGFDWQSKAAVVVVMTFFPMFINTLAGLQSVDPLHKDLMHTYAAKKRHIFFKSQLPQALPFIFNALKLNSTMALIGAIVAEFFGTPIVGMGFRISTEVGRMNMEMVWATILVAALAGSMSYGALALLERIVLFWHQSVRTTHIK